MIPSRAIRLLFSQYTQSDCTLGLAKPNYCITLMQLRSIYRSSYEVSCLFWNLVCGRTRDVPDNPVGYLIFGFQISQVRYPTKFPFGASLLGWLGRPYWESVMRIRLIYYTDPDPGFGNPPYKFGSRIRIQGKNFSYNSIFSNFVEKSVLTFWYRTAALYKIG